METEQIDKKIVPDGAEMPSGTEPASVVEAIAEVDTPGKKSQGGIPASEPPGILRSKEIFLRILPGKEFKTDEEYEAALADYLEQQEAAGRSISDILFENPELAEILTDIGKGYSFKQALLKHFGPDDFEANYNEPDADELRQIAEGRRVKIRESEERIARRDENVATSQTTFDNFVNQQGWDEEKQQEFLRWLEEVVVGLSENGIITEGTLKKLSSAFEFEEKIEEARQDGVIAGKNEKIETARTRKSTSIDGLPAGGAGAVVPKETIAPEDMDFIDEVLMSSERRNKWNK